MSMYGRAEIEFYQLTPVGQARLQSGQMGHLDVATRQILREMGELGGTAERDELRLYGTQDSPTVLTTALRRLVDLGYVTPVTK